MCAVGAHSSSRYVADDSPEPTRVRRCSPMLALHRASAIPGSASSRAEREGDRHPHLVGGSWPSSLSGCDR
eukprot:COSAG01_NODE_2846_length_6985_cov_212.725860_8_plen_71_part_00